MDTMPHDDLSLAVPLLVDKDQHRLGCKLRDVETNYSFTSSGSTSSFKTVFHGLNALSGVGILSIPYALSSGGWLSLILLFVISTAAFYTGLLIQRCMDFDSNIRTYPDIGERAFGNKGRILVSVLMYTELYLVSTGFLILEGDNLQNLFPNMGIEVAGFEIGGRQLSVIIVALIISAYVSLYAFCYCAHPVFPTLYTSMKNKHQFSNVMILCFILCSISYASMAVLGYLMFGPNVKSQITLNLPTDKLSSRLTIYTTLVNPITKYALMIMPIVNAAKSWLPVSCEKRPFSIFIGTALVISNVIVARLSPFLWRSHVAGRSIFKYDSFDHTAVVVLHEDFWNLSEIWIRDGGLMDCSSTWCFCRDIGYLHLSLGDNKALLVISRCA
ncbi:AMINO ACID TRANSPORTER AVT1J [Salix koriyanagi]|uniref:AMINO ACID TRANSPORTER AVT1J n=1 Tax=Salix koriyanagi TaxID=2511006 RepID=A0A9Q1A037_9ROSI|nr:AMINO ACID TRANSPORTER AVT1J [Salix koriyanagi]